MSSVPLPCTFGIRADNPTSLEAAQAHWSLSGSWNTSDRARHRGTVPYPAIVDTERNTTAASWPQWENDALEITTATPSEKGGKCVQAMHHRSSVGGSFTSAAETGSDPSPSQVPRIPWGSVKWSVKSLKTTNWCFNCGTDVSLLRDTEYYHSQTPDVPKCQWILDFKTTGSLRLAQ